MSRLEPDIGNLPIDLRPIVTMLLYRGFRSVKVLSSRSPFMAIGYDQTQEGHPRPNAQSIVYVDPTITFGSVELQKSIRNIYGESVSRSLPPGSSMVYVYSFPPTAAHVATIEKKYESVLSEINGHEAYYLEDIPISLFQVDWSIPRVTRNWYLRREDFFVMMYTTKGNPVVIDKPPTVITESPEIKYLGGRPDDYVTFERLESMEVGPMWMLTMRKIGRRTTDIGESSSQEQVDGDDNGLPDR